MKPHELLKINPYQYEKLISGKFDCGELETSADFFNRQWFNNNPFCSCEETDYPVDDYVIGKLTECLSQAIDSLYIPDNRSPYIASREAIVDGKYKLDSTITHYMLEPFNLLNSKVYQEIIFVGPARTGKSEFLIKWALAYAFVVARTNSMLVHMTENKALEFMDNELKPMLYRSPVICEALANTTNAVTQQRIAGKYGQSIRVLWPSKNNLASSTIQYVLLTDYDRMPADVDGEGNVYELAKTRARTFGLLGKVIVESSPGFPVVDVNQMVKPHGMHYCQGIAALYETGDKRCYYYQCRNSDCRNWFIADLSCIYYNDSLETIDEKADSARVRCPYCEKMYSDFENKSILIPKGRWLKQGEKLDKNGEYLVKKESAYVASFWLQAPACGLTTLRAIIKAKLTAEDTYEKTGDEGLLKAFYNTVCGVPYIPKEKDKTEIQDWEEKKDPNLYQNICPENTRLLIACVDIQNGRNARFVVQVFAFTDDLRTHLVSRYTIRTYQEINVEPEIYHEHFEAITDKVINQAWRVKGHDNILLRPHRVMLDTGGIGNTTENAYTYWLNLKQQGLGDKVLLVKGMPPTFNFKVRASNPKSNPKVVLLNVKVNEYKHIAYANLNRKQGEPSSVSFYFNSSDEIFAELTAEKRNDKGVYEKISNKRSNEAIDLFVYYYACLEYMQVREALVAEGKVKLPSYLLPLHQGNANVVDIKDVEDLDLMQKFQDGNAANQQSYALRQQNILNAGRKKKKRSQKSQFKNLFL